MEQSTKKCTGCQAPAAMKCGRCLVAHYCGKDCQVANWKDHSRTCISRASVETNYARFLERANVQISGNIFILASHRYAIEGKGLIFVEINESMEEFMREQGDLHFAHLKFVKFEEYKCAAMNDYSLTINVPPFDMTSVVVIYVLKDFHLVIMMTPKSELTNLRSQHSAPDSEWSILFIL